MGMFALRVPKSLARWQHGMLWTQRAGRAPAGPGITLRAATAADAPRTETAFHIFFRFIILLKWVATVDFDIRKTMTRVKTERQTTTSSLSGRKGSWSNGHQKLRSTKDTMLSHILTYTVEICDNIVSEYERYDVITYFNLHSWN